MEQEEILKKDSISATHCFRSTLQSNGFFGQLLCTSYQIDKERKAKSGFFDFYTKKYNLDPGKDKVFNRTYGLTNE